MAHAFKSDFCAVAAQLRHKISRWELFFEAVNKRQQIKFFYLSKGAFLWDDPDQDQWSEITQIIVIACFQIIVIAGLRPSQNVKLGIFTW